MKKRILSTLVATVVLLSSLYLFTGCGGGKVDPTFEVKTIAELATLKAYYHNVGEYKDEKVWSKIMGKHGFGYKKAWIEYTGIVTYGIDVNKVIIDGPNEKNVVTITIPEAEIQSINIDEDSMSDPYTDAGLFTKVTAEDKTKLVADAQANMKETAEKDDSLKTRAQDHAKKILENYVVNVGESLGQTYTVEFKEAK